MSIYEPSDRTASVKQMLQECDGKPSEAELRVMLSQHNADLVGAYVKLYPNNRPDLLLKCIWDGIFINSDLILAHNKQFNKF